MPEWLAVEVAERRRADSYGGELWTFPHDEPVLSPARAYIVSEAEWLLDGGVHPLLISDVLKRAPSTIYSNAHLAANKRVMSAFSPLLKKAS
ncbi:hypothetical protein MN032_10870 [Agromyces atrinae]|uniref:hypothetical protein n=1 Tax=Agromyces atrinae TaxID=592376 RepID=UPI001F576EC2|nr:hypothetical protein [Agromyces atrinae]MCI2958199.1 hypothetical protein [Agromyces atrinae]